MNKFVSLVFLFAVVFLEASSAIQCRIGIRNVQGDTEVTNTFENRECPSDMFICSRLDFTATVNGATGNYIKIDMF